MHSLINVPAAQAIAQFALNTSKVRRQRRHFKFKPGGRLGHISNRYNKGGMLWVRFIKTANFACFFSIAQILLATTRLIQFFCFLRLSPKRCKNFLTEIRSNRDIFGWKGIFPPGFTINVRNNEAREIKTDATTAASPKTFWHHPYGSREDTNNQKVRFWCYRSLS